MPPKKGKGGGGGKKKGGGGGSGGVVDGVDTTEMNREQLEAHCHRLREELEREREERNFFQIERDKLKSFWDITRKELEETKAELRNKDRDMEEEEEAHQSEMKFLRQKIKHLLYEHQNNLAELKAENMVSLKLSQENHQEEEGELLKDIQKLKENLEEKEIDHQEQLRTLRLKHSEEIVALQEKFLRKAEEIEDKAERDLTALRDELSLTHRMELTEVEERKNQQIETLIQNHEQAFADAKNYYNDITLNNLSLIGSLKEELENQKQQSERMERHVRDVQNENSSLVEPLRIAKKEVAELKRNLQNYEKDKICLANTRLKLKICQKEVDDLSSENGVLDVSLQKLQREKEDLEKKLTAGVLEIQQRLGLKSEILNHKVTALLETLERKEVQLRQIIEASHLDPNAVAGITLQIEDVLYRKDAAYRELQWELSRVTKAHDDLICTYEAKLRQLGISQSELGFEPLRLMTGPQQSGSSTQDGSSSIAKRNRMGPAGLVTFNL
ncbi:dynein regulatory complex subunit 4 isoform X1 [Ischnura elegans]|uniref:dynein regulatory complex subunit 4 isoform X1 n=1 Tax=Ischnura elegans TaxID=197161 RepID=UPI001ED8BB73|nr:dynein regulatory complex subunit 4 isoform X1 [Ischnura elegans]